MPDLNDIVDMADHLLETINRVYAEQDTVVLPDRQYYIIGGQGQTVHECEQLTVSWDQAYSGLPGNEASIPAKCDSIHTASFVVEVVRAINTARNMNEAVSPTAPGSTTNIPGRYAGAVGTVGMPSEEDYMREARQQMRDAVLLLRAGLEAGDATLGESSIVDVSAGAPQGGYQATIMNFTATLAMDPYRNI